MSWIQRLFRWRIQFNAIRSVPLPEQGAKPSETARAVGGSVPRVSNVLCDQFHDRESDRIAEQAAQARLPAAVLFHAASLSCFRNSENVKMTGPS